MSTTPIPETTPIQVTVTYTLSEKGQRAALLAGKDAARSQTINGAIPADLLDMCRINPDGSVTADYTKEIHFDQQGEITFSSFSSTRIYSPEQDQPASSAAALLAAIRDGIRAKGAEAKAKYEAELAEQARRNQAREEEYQTWLSATQQAMDADPQFVPTSHPPGYSGHSWYGSEVPLAVAIRRRVKANEQAAERDRRAAIRNSLILSADQIERFDAGVLPEAELRQTIADWAFAALSDFSLFEKITRGDVVAALDRDDEDAEVKAAVYRTLPAPSLTSEQWQKIKAMRTACPGAVIEPILHQGSLDDNDTPWDAVERVGAVAKMTVAGIEVRREYAL